jgi:hypothetical protein
MLTAVNGYLKLLERHIPNIMDDPLAQFVNALIIKNISNPYNMPVII